MGCPRGSGETASCIGSPSILNRAPAAVGRQGIRVFLPSSPGVFTCQVVKRRPPLPVSESDVPRFLRKLRLQVNSRHLTDPEWICTFTGPHQLGFTFFAPRRPMLLEFHLRRSEPVRILEVETKKNGTWSSLDFSVDTERNEEGVAVLVEPVERVMARQLRVQFEAVEDPFEFRTMVRVGKDRHLDFLHLQRAIEAVNRERSTDAYQALREYEEHASENPFAFYLLSDILKEWGRAEEAEEYAMRAFAFGHPAAAEQYRLLRENRSPWSNDQIQERRDEARDWTVDGHHGLLVLDRSQEFLLGHGHWHFQRTRELLEVRRPAAARLLRSLSFTYSAHMSALLHTSLRIVHTDGAGEDVSPENFHLTDSHEQNVFVAVEDEKAGNWILPDLETGDVIEWSHDLANRDQVIRDNHRYFVFSSLYDEHHPTFRARCRFVAPEDMNVRITTRNFETAPEESREVVSDRLFYEVRGDRFVPAKYSGMPYENNYLNPLVACSSRDLTWAEVSDEAGEVNFGVVNLDEPVPDSILAAMGEDQDSTVALERAYYWTRDKLKYASLESGNLRVGQKGQATEIVKAGTADCKEKSYLFVPGLPILEGPLPVRGRFHENRHDPG